MWQKAKSLRKSIRFPKSKKKKIVNDIMKNTASNNPTENRQVKRASLPEFAVANLTVRVPLNADVFSKVAEYLDLESYLNLSVSCKLVQRALRRIPLDLILLGDIQVSLPVLLKERQLPRSVAILVYGTGASNSIPSIVARYERHEKQVSEAKQEALGKLVKRLKQSYENHNIIDVFQKLFVFSIERNNILAVEQLLSLDDAHLWFPQEFVEESLQIAAHSELCELVCFFTVHIGYQRVPLNLLFKLGKDARRSGQIRMFSTLLALICNCSVNDQESINEFISSCMYAAAKAGQETICLELANMFQLRVGVKKLRILQDREAQSNRMNSKIVSNINEEMESERLRGEEGEVSQSTRVFKRALQTVLQTACRNNHTGLARRLLESKLASDVDEQIMFNFFKTAVGNGDETTSKWLIESRLISMERICEYFINCARRNYPNSARIIMATKVLSTASLEHASDTALRYGHKEFSQLVRDYLPSE